MKKIFVIVALLFVAVFAFHSAASAAWYQATVSETGIDPVTGVTFVKLTCVAGCPGSGWSTAQWYTASGENAKAMMAVALTAISTGYKVTVSLDNVAEWSTCNGLFMQDD